jgi:quercetin dioxygenase-like cupin family protein
MATTCLAGARLHAHDAAEFLHLLSGDLLVEVDGIEHLLCPGDSLYIHPAVPHSYLKRGRERCQAVVITTASPAASVVVEDRARRRRAR